MVLVWLVERTYTDKGLVTLVYATPDGKRHLRSQRSERALLRQDVTAGQDVDPDRLQSTPAAERERFATEAARMADRHDPGDVV